MTKFQVKKNLKIILEEFLGTFTWKLYKENYLFIKF